MAMIELRGRRLPARAIACALLLSAGLYVADATYFGFTRLGYADTVAAAIEGLAIEREIIPEKRQQLADLSMRAKELNQVFGENKALEQHIALLQSRVREKKPVSQP